MYIIFICLLHFYILNPFEKVFFSYNLDNTNRPLEECKNKKYNGCNGFPSGHAEIITIVCAYLLFNKIISIPIAVLLIVIVCIQRLLTKMHTFNQVLYGFYFGFIYSYLYWITNFSGYSLLVSLSSMVILTITIHCIMKTFLNDPLPDWVDPLMYDKINEKKNKNLFVQIAPIYDYTMSSQNCIFLSWREVELLLDKVILKIKDSGIKYDGIVGIKTGGAIVSDYISKKLNIKNYKIKVKNINGTIHINAISIMKKMNNKEEYVVEDDIADEVANKNIILIDESIFTGVTMEVAIDYLKPKVKHLYPVVLCGNGNILNGMKDVDVIDLHPLNIWPWGHDN